MNTSVSCEMVSRVGMALMVEKSSSELREASAAEIIDMAKEVAVTSV